MKCNSQYACAQNTQMYELWIDECGKYTHYTLNLHTASVDIHVICRHIEECNSAICWSAWVATVLQCTGWANEDQDLLRIKKSLSFSSRLFFLSSSPCTRPAESHPININTASWVNIACWFCSHLTSTWPNTIDSTGTWKKEKCAESLFKSPAISLSNSNSSTDVTGTAAVSATSRAYLTHWWARSSGDQSEIRDTEFKTDGENEKRRTEIDWERVGRRIS